VLDRGLPLTVIISEWVIATVNQLEFQVVFLFDAKWCDESIPILSIVDITARVAGNVVVKSSRPIF